MARTPKPEFCSAFKTIGKWRKNHPLLPLKTENLHGVTTVSCKQPRATPRGFSTKCHPRARSRTSVISVSHRHTSVFSATVKRAKITNHLIKVNQHSTGYVITVNDMQCCSRLVLKVLDETRKIAYRIIDLGYQSESSGCLFLKAAIFIVDKSCLPSLFSNVCTSLQRYYVRNQIQRRRPPCWFSLIIDSGNVTML